MARRTAPGHKERRWITVLFSDLKGFSTLAEAMDPEDVEEILDELFRRLRRVIEAEGGTVDKFMGDAVMAVWGAPKAHEDDALRAVRAGLKLQEEIGAFNRGKNLDLRIRVGINSGETVWGRTGGGQPTATGDAVNVAQRLEAVCEPGQVMVSESVRNQTEGQVLYRKLDPVRVKGRRKPVNRYEAVEVLRKEQPYRRVRGLRTEMVGRENELAWLRERWEKLPAFVWVQGEAGIGKSRLVYEFLRALGGNATVLRGRCTPESLGSFAPIGQALRSWGGDQLVSRMIAELEKLDRYEDIEHENFAHLVALAIGEDVVGARVKDLPPQRAEAERRFAFRVLFEALSKDRPLVLVIEDLHWVDPETPVLLGYLREHLKNTIVLATSRPEREPLEGFEKLELEALSGEAVRSLCGQAFGGRPGPHLEKFIRRQAGGNPYFAEELAAYLMENKLVGGDPPELLARPAGMPRTLHALLVARIDSLRKEVKETLKAASVIGTVFWQKLLEEVLEGEVGSGLRDAQSRSLVSVQAESSFPGDREYTFKHALLRDAAFSLLTRRDRAALHRAVGERLLSRASDRAAVLALSANHLHAAGEEERAREAWTRAAEQALEVSAFREALVYARKAGETPKAYRLRASALAGLSQYEEARRLLERTFKAAEGEEAAEALLQLSIVHERQGRFGEAVAAAGEAEAQVRGVEGEGAAVLRIKAACAAALGLHRLSRYDESLAGATRALTLGGATRRGRESDRVRSSALNVMGNVHYDRGDYARALELYEESLKIRRRIGDRHGIAVSLNNMGNVHRCRGDYTRALELYAESAEILREIGDRHGIAALLNNMGLVRHERGDYTRALELYRESLKIRREIGDRRGIATSLNNMGLLHYERGDHTRALEFHEASLEMRREIGDRHGISASLNNMANVHTARGDYARALELLEASLKIKRGIGDRHGIAMSLNNMGNVHRCRGDYTRALELYAESAEILREIGDRHGIAALLNNMGKVHAACGDYARALELYEESLKMLRGIGDRVGAVSVACWKSRALAESGGAPQAQIAAEEALAAAEELAIAPSLGEALDTVLWVALESGGAVAPERARKQLRLAREAGSAEGLALAARLAAREGNDRWARKLVQEARAFAGGWEQDFGKTAALALAEAEALADREAADRLCTLAREKGAKPLLARGLFLAGKPEEARALAMELGMKPLLARIERTVASRKRPGPA